MKNSFYSLLPTQDISELMSKMVNFGLVKSPQTAINLIDYFTSLFCC